HNEALTSERAGRVCHFPCRRDVDGRRSAIDQLGHRFCPRHQFKQQFKSLARNLDGYQGDASDVAAGRFKPVTMPNSTGSLVVRKTMGIDEVAALATLAAVSPVVMISATWRRTRSLANSGKRSGLPPAHRYSIVRFSPSTKPPSRSP